MDQLNHWKLLNLSCLVLMNLRHLSGLNYKYGFYEGDKVHLCLRILNRKDKVNSCEHCQGILRKIR